MAQSETFLNFINGKWKQGSAPNWVDNKNPANPNDVIGKITQSTAADLNEAIEAAQKAFHSWSRMPRPTRAKVLDKVCQIIRGQVEEFATAMTREEGKNLNEARGETMKTINVLEFTASEGRRPVGEVIPSEMPNTFIYTTRAPRGVVGIITPWNFPVCIPAWKIGPALLEGNTVIFKPASLTPHTAVLLTRAFEQAGVPAGVLNLVFGSGSVIGNAIVDDPRITAISFTGSNEVGRDLHARAAKRLCPTMLEMGGKNPVIVMEDADLDQATEATCMGAFGSTGQRCTATSRVIVHRDVHAKLREKLVARAKKIVVGDGMANPAAMGPVVDQSQFNTVLEGIARAKKEGCELILGGNRHGDVGYFIEPTIFDAVKPDSYLAQNELFGPVLAIIPVASWEQAIEVANNVQYGLSSSVYTKDIQRCMQYADQVETGMLHVNSPTVGGEAQAPFGGVKATGLGGREMGSTGPEFFSEIKTVYIDYNSTVRQGNLY